MREVANGPPKGGNHHICKLAIQEAQNEKTCSERWRSLPEVTQLLTGPIFSRNLLASEPSLNILIFSNFDDRILTLYNRTSLI